MKIEIIIKGEMLDENKQKIEKGIDGIKDLLTTFSITKNFKEFSGSEI